MKKLLNAGKLIVNVGQILVNCLSLCKFWVKFYHYCIFRKEQEEENESDPTKTKDVASLASNSDSPEMFQEYHDGPTIIQYEDVSFKKRCI